MGLFERRREDETMRDDDDDGVVIDLTMVERAKAARAVRTGRVQWGLPSPCPACGAAGYLDHIDLVGRVMYQHCPTCWEKWQISETDIDSAAELS